jgi:hypothetical protein
MVDGLLADGGSWPDPDPIGSSLGAPWSGTRVTVFFPQGIGNQKGLL